MLFSVLPAFALWAPWQLLRALNAAAFPSVLRLLCSVPNWTCEQAVPHVPCESWMCSLIFSQWHSFFYVPYLHLACQKAAKLLLIFVLPPRRSVPNKNWAQVLHSCGPYYGRQVPHGRVAVHISAVCCLGANHMAEWVWLTLSYKFWFVAVEWWCYYSFWSVDIIQTHSVLLSWVSFPGCLCGCYGFSYVRGGKDKLPMEEEKDF